MKRAPKEVGGHGFDPACSWTMMKKMTRKPKTHAFKTFLRADPSAMSMALEPERLQGDTAGMAAAMPRFRALRRQKIRHLDSG